MIEVDIVTPTRRLVVGAKVSSLTLPGARGQLQILPGHADLLTTLGVGVLAYAEDGAEKKFAISYGFAEVRHDKITVLAETCEPADEIDLERAQKAQKKAQEALVGQMSQEEFRKYQLKLERALIRQQISL